jgi:hypothetical protein
VVALAGDANDKKRFDFFADQFNAANELGARRYGTKARDPFPGTRLNVGDIFGRMELNRRDLRTFEPLAGSDILTQIENRQQLYSAFANTDLDAELTGVKQVGDFLHGKGASDASLEELSQTIKSLASVLDGNKISSLNQTQQVDLAEKLAKITGNAAGYKIADTGQIDTEAMQRDFHQVGMGVDHFKQVGASKAADPQYFQQVETGRRIYEAARAGSDVLTEDINDHPSTLAEHVGNTEVMNHIAEAINQGFKTIANKPGGFTGTQIASKLNHFVSTSPGVTTVRLDEIGREKLATSLGNAVVSRNRLMAKAMPPAQSVTNIHQTTTISPQSTKEAKPAGRTINDVTPPAPKQNSTINPPKGPIS